MRSNVIVGFPGETEADLGQLELFLAMGRLDVVGVFGYSDEDGTEAEGLDGKLPAEVIQERVARVTDLVEQLTAQRAEERVGESVVVLVEEVDEGIALGRSEIQGPDVDGVTRLDGMPSGSRPAVGEFVRAVVVGSEGVDLVAEAR